MSIDQRRVVDFLAYSEEEKSVSLAISDHREWDSELEHVYALQEKINDYLLFIESGELVEENPNAKGKNVLIQIYFKYEPSDLGLEFLERAKDTVRTAGFDLTFETLGPQASIQSELDNA